MNLLRRLGSIDVQNTNNQPFDNVLQMTLHWSAFFGDEIIDIIINLISCHLLVFINWFIIDCFSVFEGVHSSQTESLFGHSRFLDYSFMDPKGHFLFDHIVGEIQLRAKLLRTESLRFVLQPCFIKTVYQNCMNWHAFKFEVSVVEAQGQIHMT